MPGSHRKRHTPWGNALADILHKKDIGLNQLTEAMKAVGYTEIYPRFRYQYLQRIRDEMVQPPQYFGYYLSKALEHLGAPLTHEEAYRLVFIAHNGWDPEVDEPPDQGGGAGSVIPFAAGILAERLSS